MTAQKNPTTQSARVTPLAKTLRGLPSRCTNSGFRGLHGRHWAPPYPAPTTPASLLLPRPLQLLLRLHRWPRPLAGLSAHGRPPWATLLTGLSPRDPWPAALPWPFPFHTTPEWSSSPRVASPDPEDTHALPASVAAAGGRVPVTGRVEQRGLPAWGSRRKGF